MRKLKEVLRLHSLGLKQQQIARSCSIAQSTVHEYLKAAAAAGVNWPLPADWDDRHLEETITSKSGPIEVWRKSATPDFGAIRQQLQSHHNLTLQLVWEEYREDTPDGYSYSRFCELYREWARKLDVVLRHEHRAGEKMFVDYAGDKMPIYEQQGGAVDYEAALFVAVLGASSYTFACSRHANAARARACGGRATCPDAPNTTPRADTAAHTRCARENGLGWLHLNSHMCPNWALPAGGVAH